MDYKIVLMQNAENDPDALGKTWQVIIMISNRAVV